MDLLSKFRKDYFNYLISVILPAFISGISIPIFKHLLGAAGYGVFSIWYNAILIFTAILSGWIAQSILLFYPSSANKEVFSKKAMLLSIRTQSIFCIPVILVIWYLSKDFFFSILCSMVLCVTITQFCILPIIQSGFQSKKIIYSEFIRVTSYVLSAILLLKFSEVSYLYSLFIALVISYSLSLIYLVFQARGFFKTRISNDFAKKESVKIFKQFFNYGGPLSLWFVFSYLFSYMDKLFMLHQFGAEVQGNYQAIFDLISKSLVLIISPIITSLFPILTAAYSSGNKKDVRKLLKKIILYEILGFLAVSIMYWAFGADLLFYLLKTPHTDSLKLIGFIIICGTFVLQISALVQKRFELKLKSLYMLKMISIAFVVQITFYFVCRNIKSQLLYPSGFLLATLVYLFLISATELKSIINSWKIKAAKLPAA